MVELKEPQPNNRQQEASIRHIENIMERPLNQIRVSFSRAFISNECRKNLSLEKVNDLFKQLEALFDTEEKKEIFASHQENFAHFLKTGDIKKPLNLRDEESMLFWGIALGFYAIHPEISQDWAEKDTSRKISKTRLWKRIEKSSYMQKELKKHAYLLNATEIHEKTKIVYSEHGYPDISYCFIPKEKMIINDMLWTLICGTDASATAINHEVAHSQGTQNIETPKMLEIKKEIEALQKRLDELAKAKDTKEWKKVAKRAARLKKEYEYRYKFSDELENMFANRYSVNVGGDFDKAHLNELETVIVLGEKFLSPQQIKSFAKQLEADPKKRIQHVKDIARNSFFANNEIIYAHSYEEWHRVNLFPELLDGVDSDGVKMSSTEAFEEIRKICNQFEELQPSKSLKLLSEELYQKRMSSLSQKRARMVDEFFDKFVAHHMEPLYKEAENSVDNMLEQTKHLRNDRSNQGQERQNQDQGQNGQENDSQEGQNQGQGQNPEENEGEERQNQDQGQNPKENEDQEGQNQGQGQNPEENEGQEGQNQGQGQNGQESDSQEGQNQDQGQNPEENEGQEGENQGKENTSKDTKNNNTESIETKDGYPSSSIFDVNPKEKSKEFTEEEIKEMLENAEDIERLAEEAIKEMDEKELPQRGEDSSKTDEEKEDENNQEAKEQDFLPQKRSRPMVVDVSQHKRSESQYARSLVSGSYDDYQKYVSEFCDVISKIKRIISEIIKQKKLSSIRRGREQRRNIKTILPIQGATSIDLEAHKRLIKKIHNRDPRITKKDLRRFNTEVSVAEEEVIKETKIEESNFCILIDSSGSMIGAPYENALATACILYEAVRSIKEVNVYIYLMGEPTPYTIAKPGMKTQEIAENISRAEKSNGYSCNDYLSPAIEQCLKDVAEDYGKRPHATSGFTHIFSITDGGNNDYSFFDVNGYIRRILTANSDITFDSFFIDEEEDNYTKGFIEEMKRQGSTQIDYVEKVFGGFEIAKIKETANEKIIEMLQKRLKHSELKERKTNGVKQKLIKSVVERE